MSTITSRHCSANYILGLRDQRGLSEAGLEYIVFSNLDEAQLANERLRDASFYLYNAIISYASALSDTHKKRYGWAIVKLYYSAFYAARSCLCNKGLVVLFVQNTGSLKRTMYQAECAAGRTPEKCKKAKGTHELVCRLANEYKAVPFAYNQLIDSLPALNWLSEIRNEIQYRLPSFTDPNPPSVIKCVPFDKLENAIQAYFTDKDYLSTFDPDHAVYALPLQILRFAAQSISKPISNVLSPEQTAELTRSCKIGTKKNTVLSSIVKYANKEN